MAEEGIPNGCFRDCKPFLLRLAEFYRRMNCNIPDKRRWFNLDQLDQEPYQFIVAFGSDIAPGVATSFLMLFLNVGWRILSSFENFLVFGSNVSETLIMEEEGNYFARYDIPRAKRQRRCVFLGHMCHVCTNCCENVRPY